MNSDEINNGQKTGGGRKSESELNLHIMESTLMASVLALMKKEFSNIFLKA